MMDFFFSFGYISRFYYLPVLLYCVMPMLKIINAQMLDQQCL